MGLKVVQLMPYILQTLYYSKPVASILGSILLKSRIKLQFYSYIVLIIFLLYVGADLEAKRILQKE